MARHRASDNLPEPGDDSAIEAQLAGSGYDPALSAAAAERARDTQSVSDAVQAALAAEPVPGPYVALADVGRFRAGERITEGHWSEPRLATLLAEGKIGPTEDV